MGLDSFIYVRSKQLFLYSVSLVDYYQCWWYLFSFLFATQSKFAVIPLSNRDVEDATFELKTQSVEIVTPSMGRRTNHKSSVACWNIIKNIIQCMITEITFFLNQVKSRCNINTGRSFDSFYVQIWNVSAIVIKKLRDSYNFRRYLFECMTFGLQFKISQIEKHIVFWKWLDCKIYAGLHCYGNLVF